MKNERNDNKAIRAFWDAYRASARIEADDYVVLQFGDGSALADELAAQVVARRKHATTSLLRDRTITGRPILKPGDRCVVIDGTDTPRCIVQILQVEIKRLRDVDEDFAWDDGGGDGSLAWWRAAQERYFRRQGAREGFTVDDTTFVVLERFAVVWPLERAGRR